VKAKEFGYWVSERSASKHPATADYASEYCAKPTTSVWTPLGIMIWVIGFLVIFWDGLENSGFGVVLMVILTIVIVACVITAAEILRETVSRARIKELLRRHPWQAWPCRMEKRYELHILGPHRETIKTLRPVIATEIHSEIWESVTDGVGVVWLCGDLREDVLVAPVGGSPISRVKPKLINLARPLTDIQKTAVNAAIQFAGAAAMELWLKPPE